jgi:hypothetical protein
MQPRQKQRQHKSAAALIPKRQRLDIPLIIWGISKENLLCTAAIHELTGCHLSIVACWAIDCCWSLLQWSERCGGWPVILVLSRHNVFVFNHGIHEKLACLSGKGGSFRSVSLGFRFLWHSNRVIYTRELSLTVHSHFPERTVIFNSARDDFPRMQGTMQLRVHET